MEELEGAIRYWEGKLKHMRAYLTPTEEALIITTIKFLKELQKIKEGAKADE